MPRVGFVDRGEYVVAFGGDPNDAETWEFDDEGDLVPDGFRIYTNFEAMDMPAGGTRTTAWADLYHGADYAANSMYGTNTIRDDDRPKAVIPHLHVHDKYRGRGFGKVLFDYFKAIAAFRRNAGRYCGGTIGGGDDTRQFLVSQGIPPGDIVDKHSDIVGFTTEIDVLMANDDSMGVDTV